MDAPFEFRFRPAWRLTYDAAYDGLVGVHDGHLVDEVLGVAQMGLLGFLHAMGGTL